MEKAVSVGKEDFASIRTGRAHPSLFNKILVDYYGAPTPINQVASFHVADARMITVHPYDKSSMAAVERAIRDSDLGVNPSNDGQVIRVVLPQLTEERRKEYIKLAREKAEGIRVSIRNIRRHAKETLEKLVHDGEVGEDEAGRAEKQLETLTKNHVDQVDELLKHKEAELLEV
nr:ribosome recycling factor [Phytoactinopolyspora mesophila]